MTYSGSGPGNYDRKLDVPLRTTIRCIYNRYLGNYNTAVSWINCKNFYFPPQNVIMIHLPITKLIYLITWLTWMVAKTNNGINNLRNMIIHKNTESTSMKSWDSWSCSFFRIICMHLHPNHLSTLHENTKLWKYLRQRCPVQAASWHGQVTGAWRCDRGVRGCHSQCIGAYTDSI